MLSDDYVARVEAATTRFDAPFQELITEAAWGNLWSRTEWTKRERSMVTIALLAALGHTDELAMHIRATERTGATEADVREALLHVAIYAGVPYVGLYLLSGAVGTLAALWFSRQGGLPND